ncbi:sulfite exporter TauE/SafE family protein [Actinomycetaceae bacterium TAE3-ERU4]|nr:sulfite exporter TauE/SafE family protein [Actinomycetaceae bacterium TAE3-ERU4]
MHLAVIVAVLILAVAVQGVAGMGFGMIAVPFLVWHFGAIDGITWANVCGLMVAAGLFWMNREAVEWQKVGLFLIGSVPAIFATVYLLKAIPEEKIHFFVGALMLGMVIFSLLALKLPAVSGRWPALLTGFLGGFLSLSVAQSGPVMAAYAQATRWPQKSFAATLQPYFLALALIIVPLKLTLGLTSDMSGLYSWEIVFFAAAIAFGAYVSKWLAKILSPMRARYLAIAVATLGSLHVLGLF